MLIDVQDNFNSMNFRKFLCDTKRESQMLIVQTNVHLHTQTLLASSVARLLL